MHIAKVKIANILGIEHLEFEAGSFNQIAGPNGSGKTSVLEAIKAVVRGGEDATLLRNGAAKGEVVLVLDDGTELKKRLTEKGATTIVEKDGVRSTAPALAIKALADMLSVNPIDFLRYSNSADGKNRRLTAMLECLPIQADPARLLKIAGPGAAKVADPDAPALDQIDAVYRTIFEDRTGTNRAIREKEGTISQLSATLPVVEPGEITGDLGTLETALSKIDAERDAAFQRIDEKLGRMRADSDAKTSAWRAEIDRLKDQIQAETEAFAEQHNRASRQRGIDQDKHATARAPILAQLTALRQGQDAVVRAATTRGTIKTLRGEADALREDAEAQTTTLEALKAYRIEMLSSLPIDGLEVRDGEIFRHGVVFERLNTQQQVEIAVELAKLRAGDLGVICVDGLELLDRDHLTAFRDRAMESGLQLFVTVVSDGEFAVNAQN